MKELTTTSVLSLFDTDKEQRALFVQNVINTLDAGTIDPLKLHVQIKCMEDIIARLKRHPEYRDAVSSQASMYGRGKHDFHNATFEVKATAGSYDYSHDAEWCRLRDMMKAREGFLKNLTEPMDYVTGDGEVCKVYPAKYTPGADSVFITLK
jgi:hypothetical protein